MHLVKSLLIVALATPLVVAGPRDNALRRRTGDDDKDLSASSLPTTDLTPSSSPSAKDQPSLTLAGTAPFGTGISSAPETTQEVVITDVVYTTLTTCPVTSLVTSGSVSFEEVTTTISTVTRTSTSTLCTKCVAPPSKPEVPGTTASPSGSLVFLNSVSLTVSATSGASSTLEIPGYGIVPSPTRTPGSPREKLISNATSSIIPVYTAALLGNAYGGGFVGTPSVYVTKLPYPNGPSSGVPPGYESASSITFIENNVTAVATGLEASSTIAAGLQSTTATGLPAFTATIVSNASTLFGSLGASAISATASKLEGSTPTFISLSPFGGEVGQESVSTATPAAVSIEIPNSSGAAIIESKASVASSATGSVQTGNSESSGVNVITSLVAATSPASALSSEVSQVSNAVLSSLVAAGLPTSPVSVQVAVVGSSATSIIGSSGETIESRFPISTLIGGAAILSTVATVFPNGAGSSSSQAITAAENAGSLTTSVVDSADAIEASIVPATTAILSPTPSTSGAIIEATPAGSPSSGEIGATIIPFPPSEQSVGPVVTLAVGSSAEQNLAPGQPAPSVPGPIIIANGTTALAVVPSPVVGPNGLTSLAIFSTPIAPAAGLTTPAVLLTPFVGANGLTSLAVAATPVIGANGLTSLAVGFETETTPAAVGQSHSAPTPVESFVVIQSPAFIPQISGSISHQANIAASGATNIILPSGSAEFPVSGGSGSGNYSIHVPLNPTAASQFQGSAVRLSSGFSAGLFGLMVFLVLL